MRIIWDELEDKRYSISEVANLFNVATSLLRYWEKEFSIIRPKKNSSNIRYYELDDIKSIQVVYNLIKIKGMTIAGAQSALKADKAQQITKAEIISRLKAVYNELDAMHTQLTKKS